MGAGYHTIHHTTYRHNYGHYTIWMDWMFGTLNEPEDILKKAWVSRSCGIPMVLLLELLDLFPVFLIRWACSALSVYVGISVLITLLGSYGFVLIL